MEDLTRERAIEILEGGKVAHIGVVSNGEAYVTPMSYVYDDDRLSFRTGPGRRLDAMKQNPNVCVEVSEYDEETGNWASAIAWGEAHVSEDGDDKCRAVEALLRKYENVIGSPLSFSSAQPVSGFSYVVCVHVTELSGRGSGGGLTPRTRPGRL